MSALCACARVCAEAHLLQPCQGQHSMLCLSMERNAHTSQTYWSLGLNVLRHGTDCRAWVHPKSLSHGVEAHNILQNYLNVQIKLLMLQRWITNKLEHVQAPDVQVLHRLRSLFLPFSCHLHSAINSHLENQFLTFVSWCRIVHLCITMHPRVDFISWNPEQFLTHAVIEYVVFAVCVTTAQICFFH